MCIRDRGYHTKWAKYIKLVEKCINETYHDMIEMTPYQAQWGLKPKRVWESYVDRELVREDRKNYHGKIYQKIKRKGERRAQKQNEEKNKLKFNVGDLILIKTNPISDTVNKVTAKFCELYEGPYLSLIHI